MWQDPGRELADLAAMHSFCVGVLERALEHPVPVPTGLSPASLPANLSNEQKLALTLNIQRRWMNVLNMAVTTDMYRNALNENTSARTVEALLRYYAWKEKHFPGERDKADLLVTFLFKRSKADVSDTESARHARRTFEAKLVGMLGDEPLPDHYAQLAREFEVIRLEVDEMSDFDKLVESGIIARVREMKESFGDMFYHPRVLAAVAVHNAAFGEQFGKLFKAASAKIQDFAQKVREGNAAADEKLAAQMAKLDGAMVLNDEYQRAQAHFHEISRYKKVAETRAEPARRAQASVRPMTTAARPEKPASAAVLEAQRGMLAQIEDGKLKTVEDAIRNFVLAAGPRPTCLMPLRNVNLPMVAAEIEAFRTDFGTEKSFRADFAGTHRRVVVVLARMVSELKDFQTKQNSEFLWKPHADSVSFLLTVASSALEAAEKMMKIADDRGLKEKAAGLRHSATRLRGEMRTAAAALEGVGAKAQQ
jgi:hypothetical protein